MKVYLIGFMGAGKSTIAPLISDRIHLPWKDTDKIIENKAQMEIPEIFKRRGEREFRNLEREAVQKVAQGEQSIVSLGGGAPLDDQNWNLIQSTGISFYLQLSSEELLERIGDAQNRPLLEGMTEQERKKEVRNLLQERAPRYRRADHTIESGGKAPAQIASEITEILEVEKEEWNE